MSDKVTIRMPSATLLPQPDAAPPENPAYVALQIAIANASGIKVTDKLIIPPAGVFLNLIFTDAGVLTVNVN